MLLGSPLFGPLFFISLDGVFTSPTKPPNLSFSHLKLNSMALSMRNNCPKGFVSGGPPSGNIRLHFQTLSRLEEMCQTQAALVLLRIYSPSRLCSTATPSNLLHGTKTSSYLAPLGVIIGEMARLRWPPAVAVALNTQTTSHQSPERTRNEVH
ncbi:hypothetical protein LY76DRAFT_411814 [Colletotrichum caudatum]|nr:hypothetical protein LY76DRAFT_411814 [Colletotrichum caudatum]